MGFDRKSLPSPADYFESQSLRLSGHGKWRTTECKFHGGSDSLRVNLATGAWVCMSCNQKGGDVLAYHMLSHDMQFIEAARALGCWTDDGVVPVQPKMTALSARDAIQALGFEATLCAVAAGNLGHGVKLNAKDFERLLVAAGRINKIMGDFQ